MYIMPGIMGITNTAMQYTSLCNNFFLFRSVHKITELLLIITTNTLLRNKQKLQNGRGFGVSQGTDGIGNDIECTRNALGLHMGKEPEKAQLFNPLTPRSD